MSGNVFKGQLKRGKVTSVKVDVEFPDGSKQTFDIEATSQVGGLVFDDGVMKDLLQTRADAGDPDWAEAIKMWEAGGVDWKERPSYIVLPTVDFDRCGPGNCSAAKDGVCIGGGCCAR